MDMHVSCREAILSLKSRSVRTVIVPEVPFLFFVFFVHAGCSQKGCFEVRLEAVHFETILSFLSFPPKHARLTSQHPTPPSFCLFFFVFFLLVSLLLFLVLEWQSYLGKMRPGGLHRISVVTNHTMRRQTSPVLAILAAIGSSAMDAVQQTNYDGNPDNTYYNALYLHTI